MARWPRAVMLRGRLPLTLIGALAAFIISAGISSAADYPTRPITIIVPFAAGGPTDILARLFGQSMSQSLGQPIVIENVTGAGGSIGAARVAHATADGYTLVMGNLGTHAAAVGLYENLTYDPRKDFEPIMLVASTPMVLDLRSGFPAKSLKEFTDYAKTHSLTAGSAGIGSISHLTYLLYTHITGVTNSTCAVSRIVRSDERSARRSDRHALRSGRDFDASYQSGQGHPAGRHDKGPRALNSRRANLG